MPMRVWKHYISFVLKLSISPLECSERLPRLTAHTSSEPIAAPFARPR